MAHDILLQQDVVIAQAVEDALCYGWIDDVLEGMDQDSYAFRFVPISRDHEWSSSDKAKACMLMKQGGMEGIGVGGG